MSSVCPYLKTGKEYASLVFLELPLKGFMYCATLAGNAVYPGTPLMCYSFIYEDQGHALYKMMWALHP